MGNELSLDKPSKKVFSFWAKRNRQDADDDNTYFDECMAELARHCEKRPSCDDILSRKRFRSCKKRHVNYVRDETGNLVQATPRLTSWYLSYVSNPRKENEHWLNKFRRRFRLPYAQFLDLVADAKAHPEYFKRWMSKDAVGLESSPLELMILGALRYLGRGWTFDDLEEATAIDEETHRQFFHVFIEYGSTVLFSRYVTSPSNSQEAADHMAEFKIAGFPGAVGSSDATHIMMGKCSYHLKQMHSSWKLPYTARTYNMTVNHRRRILNTTNGHPARWNDKTIIWWDDFVRAIHDGELLDNVEFELFERDENGNVVTVRYRGVWIWMRKWLMGQCQSQQSSSHFHQPMKHELSGSCPLLSSVAGWWSTLIYCSNGTKSSGRPAIE